MRGRIIVVCALALGIVVLTASPRLLSRGLPPRPPAARPADLTLDGAATWQSLGDPHRDLVGDGVALDSSRPAGSVTRTVTNLNAAKNRWFRFAFRGLPQAHFAVDDGDLFVRVAFFGDHGKTDHDAKTKKIYDHVEQARRDLSVNGVHREHGAEAWRTYGVDFCLPFPQTDTVQCTVGFSHGVAAGRDESAFLVEGFTLTPIPAPAGDTPATRPSAVVPAGTLLPLGGRWSYAAKPGETKPPRQFDATNADRLLYHDAVYSAPFAGNCTATLRAGFMDASGDVVTSDRELADNVTITFDSTCLVLRSHGVPNHPTGRFPEGGFGNRSYVQEQVHTFYLPLDPKPNPRLRVTDTGNRNGALHMGPIGVAVNGVVFFNPFDMGNQDATDLMDRCCGHPNPDNQYHYHKYPICINSPWHDSGDGHSALLGWAFDGVPVYGPYESNGVMAKDVTGAHALNGLNAHYDAERGWHYHVTPGRFPYLIGGFWGVEDSRNADDPHHPGGPGGGGPGSGGFGGRRGPPPGGFPPDGPPPGPPD